MATVRIPPVLRASVGGEREVNAAGATVGEVLGGLADQHPETRTQLFGGDGGLNRYVNVYLNDEDVRVLDGLQTPVAESDTLVILPAMAGGSPAAPLGRQGAARSGRPGPASSTSAAARRWTGQRCRLIAELDTAAARR